MTGLGKAEEKRPFISTGKSGRVRHRVKESYKVTCLTVFLKLCGCPLMGLTIVLNLALKLRDTYLSLN